MIKIIIANNNDILYNSLSNNIPKNIATIETINLSIDKVHSLVYTINRKENLIILDVSTSVLFCINMLKNILTQLDKENIIILVVDSRHIPNITNQKKFFIKKTNTLSTFDAINIISASIKDTIELERLIDDILWQLGFPSYFKGTIYLKDAILMAFDNNKLVQDTYSLLKKIALKNHISNEKIIRSDIDKSINSILDYTRSEIIYEVFGNDYDGRKVSFKYFIDLCIRHLNKKRYCCLEK